MFLYVGLLAGALTFGLIRLAPRKITASRAAIIRFFKVIFSTFADFFRLDVRLSGVARFGERIVLSAFSVCS